MPQETIVIRHYRLEALVNLIFMFIVLGFLVNENASYIQKLPFVVFIIAWSMTWACVAWLQRIEINGAKLVYYPGLGRAKHFDMTKLTIFQPTTPQSLLRSLLTRRDEWIIEDVTGERAKLDFGSNGLPNRHILFRHILPYIPDGSVAAYVRGEVAKSDRFDQHPPDPITPKYFLKALGKTLLFLILPATVISIILFAMTSNLR
jgi:hypothetical protein